MRQEKWPKEKEDTDGWGNGDRSLQINLEESMGNIVKGQTIWMEPEGQQECYNCRLPQRLCKGEGLARQCTSDPDDGRRSLRQLYKNVQEVLKYK